MTTFPIVDPAEIAKLPEAVYRDASGVTIQKKNGKFYPLFISGTEMDVAPLTPGEIACEGGGIAGRLVLESDPVRLADAICVAVRLGRKVYPYDVCDGCQGLGVRQYGSTATWRGGIGGSKMTHDVCDKCWGSGSKSEPWLSHREAEQTATQRDRAVELVRDLTDIVDEKVWTAFAIAGMVEEWLPKARAVLAEQGAGE